MGEPLLPGNMGGLDPVKIGETDPVWGEVGPGCGDVGGNGDSGCFSVAVDERESKPLSRLFAVWLKALMVLLRAGG